MPGTRMVNAGAIVYSMRMPTSSKPTSVNDSEWPGKRSGVATTSNASGSTWRAAYACARLAVGSGKSYCLLMSAADTVHKPDFAAKRKHFIFTEEHEALRESIRSFAIKELAPHAEEWEETTFPDSVFPRMGELGFLGLSYPEAYGGQGGDYFASLVLAEEIVHARSGGLAMGIAVHTDMATPLIHLLGTEQQKQDYLVPSIRGEKISCLGITEPDAGSDVSGIKTRAVRDGDEWVINGSKTYITNGHRADYIVLVTKTDPDAGHDGFTLFIVDMDAPGVIREK